MDAVTQVISILLIVLALVVSIIATQFVRRARNRFPLRVIPAFSVLPDYVGLSIEANSPLHLAMGSSGVGGTSTLLSLASAEFFYQIAQRASISDVAPILTMSNASSLPLAQDTLRRAFISRGRATRYSFTNARWYPTGSRSMAYAAAITSLMNNKQPAANIFAGSFGIELGLMMEAGARRNIPSIGVSDQLEGQAVAYAFSEHVLIGEEIFAAGAYLGQGASQVAEQIALDMLRWLLIIGIVGTMLYGLFTRGG